jgi:hypothetical protein
MTRFSAPFFAGSNQSVATAPAVQREGCSHRYVEFSYKKQVIFVM